MIERVKPKKHEPMKYIRFTKNGFVTKYHGEIADMFIARGQATQVNTPQDQIDADAQAERRKMEAVKNRASGPVNHIVTGNEIL